MQIQDAPKCGGKRQRGVIARDREEQPLITVITAVFNSAKTLEKTILSVLSQSYRNLEYLVIDGGSDDGSLEIIKRYDHAIDYWVSEPDKGVYDAMNKGVRASQGNWLNFLNANDIFYDAATVESVAATLSQADARFIYSDVILVAAQTAPRRYDCSHQRLVLNHQASIYHKSLHADHGLYLVAPGITISDYLFFSLIDKSEFKKFPHPIALYDTTGMSQSPKAVEQKLIIDYLLNGMPKLKFSLYFLLYFYYREAKAKLMRFWPRFGSGD